MPQTMIALLLENAGAAFKQAQIAKPIAQAGEVLVQIKASGINALDTKIRAGKAEHARQPLPAILGIDMAGVVESVGAGVSSFKSGDEVYGMTGGVGGIQGSLAQYAAVDAHLLALKPRNISMREAAALPLVFITAWEGLIDRANIKAGQKVLIHGGAGGVGHVAIQIATARGAEVFSTCSSRHIDYVQSLGATAIDYKNNPVATYVDKYTASQGFDLVYDTVGGATLDASFAAVRRFGHVVSCLGWGTHALAPLSFKAATYSGVFTLLPLLSGVGREHHGAIMQEATSLVEAGLLKPRLASDTVVFDQMEKAYQLIESGQADGRLTVDIPN